MISINRHRLLLESDSHVFLPQRLRARKAKKSWITRWPGIREPVSLPLQQPLPSHTLMNRYTHFAGLCLSVHNFRRWIKQLVPDDLPNTFQIHKEVKFLRAACMLTLSMHLILFEYFPLKKSVDVFIYIGLLKTQSVFIKVNSNL
jgi:hypothetical protein